MQSNTSTAIPLHIWKFFLFGGKQQYFHFMEKEMEAQRGQGTCPRSHRQKCEEQLQRPELLPTLSRTVGCIQGWTPGLWAG